MFQAFGKRHTESELVTFTVTVLVPNVGKQKYDNVYAANRNEASELALVGAPAGTKVVHIKQK